MPEEKFDDLIGVKCHQRTRAALKRIASVHGLEDADLLRFAARGIIEFAADHGAEKLPLNMAIRQARTPENKEAMTLDEMGLAAEAPQAPYGEVTNKVIGAADAKAEANREKGRKAGSGDPKRPDTGGARAKS